MPASLHLHEASRPTTAAPGGGEVNTSDVEQIGLQL